MSTNWQDVNQTRHVTKLLLACSPLNCGPAAPQLSSFDFAAKVYYHYYLLFIRQSIEHR